MCLSNDFHTISRWYYEPILHYYYDLVTCMLIFLELTTNHSVRQNQAVAKQRCAFSNVSYTLSSDQVLLIAQWLPGIRSLMNTDGLMTHCTGQRCPNTVQVPKATAPISKLIDIAWLTTSKKSANIRIIRLLLNMPRMMSNNFMYLWLIFVNIILYMQCASIRFVRILLSCNHGRWFMNSCLIDFSWCCPTFLARSPERRRPCSGSHKDRRNQSI